MARIQIIIATLDKHLEKSHKEYFTAVEAAAILDRLGILKDSKTRPGSPLRKLLRDGELPHAYQVGVIWHIPHSGKKNEDNIVYGSPVKVWPIKSTSDLKLSDIGHKLEPVAIAIAHYLEKKFNKPANFFLEYSPDWLSSVPDKVLLKDHWGLVKKVYSALVDQKFDLDQQLNLLKGPGKQYFDIWFDDPYFIAVEFDEGQHFNQFRARTLDFYGDFDSAINISDYRNYCSVDKSPGISGFHKLKSPDALFPEMLPGEKQDNRMRQRAFRDFLKDLSPVAKDLCPTVRVPFQLINKKRSGFNQVDLNQIVDYLINNDFIN
jgi:hypothetical protein